MQYTTFAASLPACRRGLHSFNLKVLVDSHESVSSMMSLQLWEKLQPELMALNQRLLLWQQQVKDELGRLLDPVKAVAGEYKHEQQHEALRHAMAKAGDGPRHDLNLAIDQLCSLYLDATPSERNQMRMFLGKQPHILHDLWGYLHRAAEQVRAGGGEQWLRFGVAVASMEDLRGDYHDTLAGLGDLYMAAVEAVLQPERVFRSVAELSSEKASSEQSIRELLRNFEKSEYFQHAVQPQLAKHPAK